jgi:uncharacterized cupin superfamily protein
MQQVIKTVNKRWGCEEFLFSGAYLVKRLKLQGATSMHFHYAKCETIFVIDGCLTIEFESEEHELVVLLPGEFITIREGRVNAHAMRSEAGCVYLEASTPHEYDAQRVSEVQS